MKRISQRANKTDIASLLETKTILKPSSVGKTSKTSAAKTESLRNEAMNTASEDEKVFPHTSPTACALLMTVETSGNLLLDLLLAIPNLSLSSINRYVETAAGSRGISLSGPSMTKSFATIARQLPAMEAPKYFASAVELEAREFAMFLVSLRPIVNVTQMNHM